MNQLYLEDEKGGYFSFKFILSSVFLLLFYLIYYSFVLYLLKIYFISI